MDVQTRFNVGDTVFRLTQDLVNSDEVCEHCNRLMPGYMGPVRAVAGKVVDIYINIEGSSVRINYCLDNTNVCGLESNYYATAEEAMAAASAGCGGDALS